MITLVTQLVDGFVDLLLPRRCVQCGRPGAWLCASCGAQLRATGPGACRRCGAPAPAAAGGCVECRGRELAFGSAAAAYLYEGPARRLVTACKFRALRSLTAEMAALASGRFGEYVEELARRQAIDAVTWVPVHRERRLERGFDQAGLLAAYLAGGAGLPVVGLLRRVRQGPRQSGLGSADRAVNVRSAFVVDGTALRKAGKVKAVVLVDDVYTTGATLHECSRELSGAGCEAHAFTFARAARDRVCTGPQGT